MKEIKWVTGLELFLVINNVVIHWKLVMIKSWSWSFPHIWIFQIMDTAGLYIACGQFAADVQSSCPHVANTNSPVTFSTQAAALSEDAGFYRGLPLSALGSNGNDSTYFSSPFVIQTYCPRIKDSFGKNLPEPLIWMLFGGIIFFQLRVQDMDFIFDPKFHFMSVHISKVLVSCEFVQRKTVGKSLINSSGFHEV